MNPARRSIALDSLTQLSVGAAVGEAVLGPRVGRKAMVWGAFLGTLPDLDVLIPLDGPVEDVVYHRGFSHSLFLLALVSPLVAWLITRIHPDSRNRFRQWWLLVFLVLEIGVLLDLLTVYGTQVLWPFDTTPRAWPVLFIIDPLFTLPIVVGVSAAWFLSRKSSLFIFSGAWRWRAIAKEEKKLRSVFRYGPTSFGSKHSLCIDRRTVSFRLRHKSHRTDIKRSQHSV